MPSVIFQGSAAVCRSCNYALIGDEAALSCPSARRRSIDLEWINRTQFKDLCQFIQCRPALKQQLRVRQIVFGHAVAVVLVDPFGQRAIQRCRHDNPWIDRRQLGFVESDAQTQASRATAVLHALLEIEDFDFADQAAGAGQTAGLKIKKLVPNKKRYQIRLQQHKKVEESW